MSLQQKALEVAITQLGEQEKPLGSNWGYVSSYFEGLHIQYPKTAGVYKIKNLANDKVYVGSAVNLDRRIKKHFWELSKERHRNKHLQNAFHKRGVEYFYFIILEECEPENLIEREQFWIDYYNSAKRENGYNKQPKAYSNESNTLSQEAKDKIGAFWKGKPKTEDQNRKNSIAHIGSKNGMYGKKATEECKERLRQKNYKSRKTYTFLNPEGEKITFTGLALFCRENNLQSGAMSMVANGLQLTHKKWTKYHGTTITP